MEVLNDKLSAIKMTMGENVQTGTGGVPPEVNYQGFQSIFNPLFTDGTLTSHYLIVCMEWTQFAIFS